jgi:hypothetical protein
MHMHAQHLTSNQLYRYHINFCTPVLVLLVLQLATTITIHIGTGNMFKLPLSVDLRSSVCTSSMQ